jgi:hypothetical protein
LSGAKGAIQPAKATVFTGEPFELQVEGESSTRAGVHWRLSDPGAARLEVKGGIAWVIQHDPPAAGGVELLATTDDGVSATAKISFSVSYPLDLPHPSQIRSPVFTSSTWHDPRGKRAALIILDLMRSAPKEFVDAIGPVPIYRLAINDRDPLGMHIPVVPSVLLFEKMFKALDPEAKEWTGSDLVFASTVIHELAHAIEFNYVASASEIGSALANLLKLAGTGRTGSIITGHSVAAVFAWWWEAQVSHGVPFPFEDFTSEWSRVTGWRVRGTWLQGLFGQPARLPNALTGAEPLAPLTGLHHVSGVKRPEGSGFDTDVDVVPDVADALRRSGWVSSYAAAGPHEDFAETVTVRALGEAALNNAARDHVNAHTERDPNWTNTEAYAYVTTGPNGIDTHPYQARRKFLAEQGIYPAGAPSITLGQYIKARNSLPDYHVSYYDPTRRPIILRAAETAEADAASDDFAVDDDGNLVGGHVDEPDAIRERLAIGESFAGVAELAPSWRADFGEVLDQVGEVLTGLGAGEPPEDELDEEEALMQGLRSAELHGVGLWPYGGVDDPLARGDMLFDVDRAAWVVTGVDERGRVGQVMSARPTGSGAKPEVKRDRFVYAWRPDAAARSFAVGGAALSPAYPDAEATLTELVGLWGLVMSGDRDVGTPGGMLAQVIRAAGGRAPTDMYLLDPDEIQEYCASHGTVLGPPGSDGGALVGDVVVMGGGKRLGVLTRLSEDGATADVLFGGGPRRGQVHEEPEAVQLEHRVPLPAKATFWRPPVKT